MRQHQVKIDSKQLVISSRKAPVFIRIVLIILLSTLILIPLVVTFFTLTYGNGPHIGIVFSFLLCWGVAFYLLRILLWNSVGREVLILNTNYISYAADYRLFKDNQQEIAVKGLETDIVYGESPNQSLGRLRLRNQSTSLETVLQTTIAELEEMKEIITAHYTDYECH